MPLLGAKQDCSCEHLIALEPCESNAILLPTILSGLTEALMHFTCSYVCYVRDLTHHGMKSMGNVQSSRTLGDKMNRDTFVYCYY